MQSRTTDSSQLLNRDNGGVWERKCRVQIAGEKLGRKEERT